MRKLKKNNNFIERSLVGALDFVKDSVFAEEYALKKGVLQTLDERLKIALAVIVLSLILFSKSLYILVGFYCFCLLVAVFSSVNIIFFLKRTWIFIPIFSFFIAIPALFETFSPGEPLFIFKALGIKLTMTKQGALSASMFFMRVLTSVSFVVLLSLTTRHASLLSALRFFCVPRIFVMTLGMSYRYIYLFIDILENTYRAIKSRIGKLSSVRHGQRVVSWNIASLWKRSYQLQKDVYSAMVSRGYNGEPHACDI